MGGNFFQQKGWHLRNKGLFPSSVSSCWRVAPHRLLLHHVWLHDVSASPVESVPVRQGGHEGILLRSINPYGIIAGCTPSMVFMDYNPQESLENTINTIGTLLGVHPIVSWELGWWVYPLIYGILVGVEFRPDPIAHVVTWTPRLSFNLHHFFKLQKEVMFKIITTFADLDLDRFVWFSLDDLLKISSMEQRKATEIKKAYPTRSELQYLQ